MANQNHMLNPDKTLKLTAAIGILGISISIIYYLVAFTPKKEANKMELAKLEQETQLEQAKAEQAKTVLEMQKLETEKQVQEQTAPAPSPMATPVQKQTNTIGLNTCLANADAIYSKEVKKLCKQYVSCDTPNTALQKSVLQNDRNQAKEECYRRY